MNSDIMLGLQVTFLGFGIVIVALIVLYLLIHALGRLLSPEANLASTESKFEEDSGPQNETTTSQEPEIEDTSKQDEGELEPALLAAISASIAMMLGTTERGFRIKSVRPIKRNEELSYWTISGREELMKPHDETI